MNGALTQKNKWNTAYKEKYKLSEACWVLKENLHLLPKAGVALDLACGLGANALLLAQHGLDTHAWDISDVALSKLSRFAIDKSLTIHTLLKDIENEGLPVNSFDIIVVSQFLYRPLMPAIVNALKPNGLLFYQTFTQNKISNKGPKSTDYLLSVNELIHLLNPLELLFYREDNLSGDLKLGLRNCSYFIGKKI